MGWDPWSDEEDGFILNALRKQQSNHDLIVEFYKRFGETRTRSAIMKRRGMLYDPSDVFIESSSDAPDEPSEEMQVNLDEEFGSISVAASPSIKNPEELFARSGLDPDVWEMVDASPVRKWDVPMKVKEEPVVIPCFYVSIKVRKKWEHSSLPQPIVINYTKPTKAKKTKGTPYTSVHYSDLHIPFQDDRALNILYAILEDANPDLVVDHGDTLDAQEISKYPKDPINRVPLKEEIKQTAQHMARVTELTPHAEHIWCEGNHEDRLRRLIWSLADNRQAGEVLTLPQVAEALSWPSLLGLDQLGWEMVPYPQHKLLFNKVILTHGEKVRAQSGQSEKAELEHYSKSGLSGHTHRVGYYGKKTYDGQVGWWGLGCMCAIRTNYASFPNWQQGFCVITWADDRENFAVERVRIFDGIAYWRGKRYSG
jgi:predicted phosphodiesterase